MRLFAPFLPDGKDPPALCSRTEAYPQSPITILGT